MAFENGMYGNGVNQAMAGKDILLGVFNADGSKLLAISGQQGVTITRSRDSIDVTAKDAAGGWKSKISGLKEWTIETEGLFVPNDESLKLFNEAFEKDTHVCLKVYDNKNKKGLFGGLALISESSLEATFEEAAVYATTFEGIGQLVDISLVEGGDLMPGKTE